MGIVDRYDPMLHSPALNRSVEDVLYGERQSIQRVSFTMPTEPHPLYGYFSERARRNAAGIDYQKSVPHDLMRIQHTEFYSRSLHRPPNPDYFFEKDVPYPVGYVDHNGAGMTFAWTPLAYLLYHDRVDARDCLYYRVAMNGSSEFNRDIWTRLLQHAVMFAQIDGPEMTTLVRSLVFTDPPADLLPELMFGGKETFTMTDGLIDAASDFQHRWNCGEWWHGGSDTNRALRRLLNVGGI